MPRMLVALGCILLLGSAAMAQETLEWQFLYGHTGGDYDTPRDIAFDPDGNIIVVGIGLANTSQYSYDIILIKLDQNGDTVWTSVYGTDSLEQASEVETDADGCIYVVGLTDAYANRRPLLLKFGPAGDLLWERTLLPEETEYSASAYAMALDDWGGVYITGSGYEVSRGGYHVRTAKYNTEGDRQWVRYFDYPEAISTDEDRGLLLEAHPSGCIYVAGYGKAADITYHYDIVVLKYDTAGTLIWDNSYDGPSGVYDRPNALALDAEGNAYVAGVTGPTELFQDFVLAKFGSNNGTLDWVKVTGYAGSSEIAYDVKVDHSGDIVVGGYVFYSWPDFYLAKYDAAGNLLWDRRDFTNNSSYDYIYALDVDQYNNIYATGNSNHLNVFSPANFATVKYSPWGDIMWEGYYDGAAHGSDRAYCVAVHQDGNVVVAGVVAMDNSEDPDRDIGTIMYSQPPGCCVVRGDINYDGSPAPDISDLVYLVTYMFSSGPAPICMEAADINGDLSPAPDISDLVYLVTYMFSGGPAPVPCAVR